MQPVSESRLVLYAMWCELSTYTNCVVIINRLFGGINTEFRGSTHRLLMALEIAL
jgi:hypothetical protein